MINFKTLHTNDFGKHPDKPLSQQVLLKTRLSMAVDTGIEIVS